LILEPLVEQMIAAEPSSAWLERLESAGLPYGEVRDIASVLEHPQLVFRKMFVEADSPAGSLPLVRFPLSAPHRTRRVPALGEHTSELLAELGYDADECVRLVDKGVVAIQA
ncbi:MAG: CoA transferase, partial [Acidimicrobiaceae bacterium]|nr:CoA transferase [Acidimicrobiaceae bacterium]